MAIVYTSLWLLTKINVLKANVTLVKSQQQKDIPFIHSLNDDLLSIYYILLVLCTM